MKGFKESCAAFFRSRSNRNAIIEYGIIIVLIFAFSILALHAMGSYLDAHFNSNNSALVDTVTQSLNNAFKRIDDVTKSLTELHQNNDLFSEYGILYADAAKKTQFVNQLSAYTIANDFIEEAVFLKKDQGLLITSQGILEKREFFEVRYNCEQYNLNFFNIIETDSYTIKALPSAYYKNLAKYPSESPKRLMAFIQSIPATDINIIIFVDEERFLQYTNLAQTDEKMQFRIFDQSNTLIFSNAETNYQLNTGNVSPEYSREVIKENRRVLYVKKSDYNNFYYIAELDDSVSTGMAVGVVILILGFLLASLLAVWRIRKNNQHLTSLFRELSLDEEEGLLSLAQEQLVSLKKDMQEKDEYIHAMQQEIQHGVFAKLIHSSSYYNKHRNAVERIFEPISQREKFLMVSLEILKEGVHPVHSPAELFQQIFAEMKIQAVTMEEENGNYIFVLGMYATASIELLLEEIAKGAQELRNADMDILLSVSKEFFNLNSIYDGYNDIKICRDYRGVNDKEIILSIKDVRYGSLMYLPLNFKDEFSGKMLTGEEQVLKEYCKDIFKVNLRNNIPIIKFEFLLRTMLHTVIDVLTANKKKKNEWFEIEHMFLSKLEQLRNNYDFDGIINSFYNVVHLSIGMCDSKKTTLNRADVIKYIGSHYTEDLYLEKIATEFDTTPKYFSNYFKKEFSVGFNEYLTQIRISHAKELLIQTALPLAEVGEKVGYFNQTTFAVAFKKNVGTPPGKYRELHKSGKSEAAEK